jgi:hypothetical protein
MGSTYVANDLPEIWEALSLACVALPGVGSEEAINGQRVGYGNNTIESRISRKVSS